MLCPPLQLECRNGAQKRAFSLKREQGNRLTSGSNLVPDVPHMLEELADCKTFFSPQDAGPRELLLMKLAMLSVFSTSNLALIETLTSLYSM